MNDALPVRGIEPAIDRDNPWLGLASYSEETRAYFHGRDDEAAELARRVRRKLLTVLFGQSGLGKTSLLRAGLVPRLRDEAYCPVYVRVDYAPESPSPTEQIKQAIFRATAAAGYWTRPGSAIEGESLWEFLHHRGDLLRDAEGRTLLPLLIFDQFEEIFTLAQADDAGRERARGFIADLADLVENRPPAELERRIDADEIDPSDYDFTRADYRVLIALREDYLAHLEGLKAGMPSITQNRMRLARMTGAQALAAVREPGGQLVSEDVAESIVRFVAGGSELANAEVEPSLLSLVCRELNNVRIAQGRSEISADLLAGSRDTILDEFYERALADQPAGVRRVIEDDLLTESGYRESLAEERVARALAAAGAAPDALATLVDRRLLRIEERLDVRRVELTHDVLCSVVTTSRDLRHERDARDEAERQLAEQQEREAETKRTLARTRMVAAVSAGLMIVALAGAVFGWINLRRARAADATAQQARVLADRARGDAEKLVGFLIEDFYAELEPTGRLETMGRLAHMAVNYYDGLPPELVTPRTQLYRAMAMVREGSALQSRGEQAEADRTFDEAYAVVDRLRKTGNGSDDVTLGLALVRFSQGKTMVGGGKGTPEQLTEAADLLRPLVRSGEASRRVKLVYADVLNYLSHAQEPAKAVETCEESRVLLKTLGAHELKDLEATSIYADTTDSQARHAMGIDRFEDARRLEQEVYELAEKALAARPGDLRAMQNRILASDLLFVIADLDHDHAAAELHGKRSVETAVDYLRFNPADMAAWAYVIRERDQYGAYLLQLGQVSRAADWSRATIALRNDPRRPASLDVELISAWVTLAQLEARIGRAAAAEQALAMHASARQESAQRFADDDPRRQVAEQSPEVLRARVQLQLGNAEGALSRSIAATNRLEAIEIPFTAGGRGRMRYFLLRTALETAGAAALELGQPAQAEHLARRRLALQAKLGDDPFVMWDDNRSKVFLAHALAMQQRRDEARAALRPALEFYRREQARGATTLDFRRDYAYALLVEAQSQELSAAGATRRDAALVEARRLLAGLSAEARGLADVRQVATWIAQAERGA